MKPTIAFYMVLAVAAAVIGGKSWIPAAEDSSHYNKTSTSRKIDTEQVPTWSEGDMDFFLHGSMSTEVMFLAEFEALGYEAPKEVGVRSTGKYWAGDFGGRLDALALFAQWFRPHNAAAADRAGGTDEEISPRFARVR